MLFKYPPPWLRAKFFGDLKLNTAVIQLYKMHFLYVAIFTANFLLTPIRIIPINIIEELGACGF